MSQFKFNTISRTDIEDSLGGGHMIRAIDYDGPDNLLITGVAGSGKTTVSIMRAERLAISGKNILLVTYQDLLVENLRNIASRKLGPNIMKFHSWFLSNSDNRLENQDHTAMLDELKDCEQFDEVIIDEGQNFEERIHKTLAGKCVKLSVGADNAQKVHSQGLKTENIKAILMAKGKLLPIPLQYNYRNTYEIYNFARYFLPQNERANNDLAIDKIPKGKGKKPMVFLLPDHDTRLAQLNILLKDAGDRNVAVVVYHINEVDAYYTMIKDDLGIPCSKHHNQSHIGSQIENIIVTTYKSVQGLEFQVVILPNMEDAMSRHYQSSEHYYVGCTRAKENLYLLTMGNLIPRYLQKFPADSFDLTDVPKMAAPTKPVTKLPWDDDDLPF